MAKQLKREYTQDQRDEALHWYKKEGPAAASRRLKIPSATIKSWARSAGIQPDEAIEGLKSAVEMATLTRRQKRETILEELHDSVIELFDRLRAEHIDYRVNKDGGLIEITYTSPPPKAIKDLSDAIVNFMNLIRLESGEATSRNENVNVDQFDTLLQQYADGYNAGKQHSESKVAK